MITLENFQKFSLWWGPVLDTLVRIAPEWYSSSPIMVHGFVGRLTVCDWLSTKEPGVFVLRFSESYPGFLVISFVDDTPNWPAGVVGQRPTTHPLPHCLVTVRADSFHISFNHTPARKDPNFPNINI